MTENKRFTIDKDGITIIDNCTDGLTECKYNNEAKLLCNFLNEQDKKIIGLEKENEELKQSEQEFREYCNYLKSILEDAEILYD